MYKKIMVPLDGSKLAESVLPHVEGFIKSCEVSTLIFIRALRPEPIGTIGSYRTSEVDLGLIKENIKRVEEGKKASAEGYLAQVVDQFSNNSAVTFQTQVVFGDVAKSLIDYAEEYDIDLILIATHGRSGMSRWVRGSIADRILLASRIPVLMVQAPGTMGESREG